MFILGINEFIRNLRKNIFVVIQMVAMYIIALMAVSAFDEQYRLIDGISEVFDDTGMVIFSVNSTGDYFVSEESLKEELIKVEKVEHILNAQLYDENCVYDSKNLNSVEVIAYNSDNITYVPKLISGEWCEDVKEENGYINTVVSDNIPFGVEVGQIIEHSGYKFKVTGIVSSNEMIYGINTIYKFDEASYLDFYGTWSYEKNIGGEYLFLIPYDILKNEVMSKEGIDSDCSFFWRSFGFATIDYEDDITDEEMSYNLKVLFDKYQRELNTDVFFTKNIYDYSKELMNIKIMPLFILLFIIILALVTSLTISVVINVMYEKRNYGIYFICGNNWGKTFRFSLINWLMLSITSMILAICGYVIIWTSNVFSGLSLSFNGLHIMMIVGITMFLMLIAVLVPYVMLHKIQPVSILKENNK